MTYIRFHSSLDKSAFSLPNAPNLHAQKMTVREKISKKMAYFLGDFFFTGIAETNTAGMALIGTLMYFLMERKEMIVENLRGVK